MNFAPNVLPRRFIPAFHTAVAVGDRIQRQVNVVDLVPGGVLQLGLGAVIPADFRLLEVQDLLCDESILTGESLPVEKIDPAKMRRVFATAESQTTFTAGQPASVFRNHLSGHDGPATNRRHG